MAIARHRTVTTALAAGALALAAGLGGCGFGEGDIACSPPPQIRSEPPTGATVGAVYTYVIDALYLCGMFIVCGDVKIREMPSNASYDSSKKTIFWTPAAHQAGSDVRFSVQAGPDDCGDSAFQTWTVRVAP